MAHRQPRIALIVAVLALAGCGGGGDDKPDMTPGRSDALEEAVDSAKDKTFEMKLTRRGNVPGQGPYSFEGSGTMRSDGSAGVMKGELVDTDKRKIELEIRRDGEDTWVGGPGVTNLPGGARWIHMTADQALLERALIPALMLPVLDATYDVDEAGEEDVEGSPATHYRGLADVEKLVDEVPEFKALGRSGERVPVDAWLADGLPRRLRLDYKSGSGTMYVDAIVLGTGDPDDIPGPPAKGQTVEFSELPR